MLPFDCITNKPIIISFPVGELKNDFGAVQKRLMEQKIVAGLHLGGYYGGFDNRYLFCVTETASKDVLDTVIREVKR